jgi:hypothetical protein
LTRLATSFVLGYHGCDAAIAKKVINGKTPLLRSNSDYDWLGEGIYFWESDPLRAYEWAQWKVSTGKYEKAAVVGAVVDLGNCLDLTARENMLFLSEAYDSLKEFLAKSNQPLPVNQSVKGRPAQDMTLRKLDCAVVKHMHENFDDMRKNNIPGAPPPFDTIRAMFPEGEGLYPGAGFWKETHVQIAVINEACIKGYFLPIPPILDLLKDGGS